MNALSDGESEPLKVARSIAAPPERRPHRRPLTFHHPTAGAAVHVAPLPAEGGKQARRVDALTGLISLRRRALCHLKIELPVGLIPAVPVN